jgi:hypothetical protein
LFAFKPDNFFEVDSAFERLAPRVEL